MHRGRVVHDGEDSGETFLRAERSWATCTGLATPVDFGATLLYLRLEFGIGRRLYSLDVLGECARAGEYHSCLDSRAGFGCVRHSREPFGRSGFVLLAPSGSGLWFELFEQGVGVY